MSEFCDCAQDGYCPRYGRVMSGRFRAICQGTDCDLGTAAAFREQWAREYETVHKYESAPSPAQRISLLLKTDQAVGDAVVMTAAIYSLHTAHPGKYLTSVQSKWPDVFKYNPDVHKHIESDVEKPFDHCEPAGVVQMHYPAVHDSNERGIHFVQAYCEFLGRALGISVPLMTNRPHLYFKPDTDPRPIESYWIVCSGGKTDFTNKLWGHNNYQEVLSSLEGKVRFIQVGDNTLEQPRLDYAKYMVGQTSLRNLFYTMRHARGVLCGVSLPMHVAAALGKPSVVVAGGREPTTWNTYPKQQYVHTVGMLGCTDPQGHPGACWRSRVEPLGDSETLDKDLCLLPVVRGHEVLPKCMDMISPAQVADLILKCDEQYRGAR